MKSVELTDKDATILKEVLQTSLAELSTEIAHTDNREMRQELKEKKGIVGELLDRLGQQ